MSGLGYEWDCSCPEHAATAEDIKRWRAAGVAWIADMAPEADRERLTADVNARAAELACELADD